MQPAKERLFRPPDDSHIEELKESFRKNSVGVIAPLIAHIPNTLPNDVIKDGISTGQYFLEVIGGNHTRIALQDICAEMGIHKCTVKIYGNLSDSQALFLAHEHNLMHNVTKYTSFKDYVTCFRSVLLQKLEPLDTISEEPIPNDTVLEWKRVLVNILGLQVGWLSC